MTGYTYEQDIWNRIDEANMAAGIFQDWTTAELDQMEALAEDLNRELLGPLEIPKRITDGRDVTEIVIDYLEYAIWRRNRHELLFTTYDRLEVLRLCRDNYDDYHVIASTDGETYVTRTDLDNPDPWD